MINSRSGTVVDSDRTHSLENLQAVEGEGAQGTLQTSCDVVFGRTPRAEIPLILTLLASIVTMVRYSTSFSWSMQYFSISLGSLGQIDIGLPLFGLLPISLFAYLLHRLYDVRYVISDDAARCIKGLASFQKSDMRIEFEFIRGIEIDRGMMGRLLNYGNLKIGSAMRDRVELDLRDVHNPSYYRDIVLTRMKKRQQIRPKDD